MDFAAEKFGNPFYHLIRHGIYLAMGLVVMAITVHIPLSLWNRAGPALLVAGMLLLLLVLVPGIGRKINGAARWIELPFFNVQPSELVKLFFVIYLAGYIQRRQREISGTLGGMLKPVGLLGLAAALLLARQSRRATIELARRAGELGSLR